MAACSKIRYSNQTVAEKALKCFQDTCRRPGTKMPTGTYWCAACRSWHLTSKSPSRPAPWARKRQTDRARGSAAAAKP